MTRKISNSALLAVVAATTIMAPALARGNDLTIKDGFGEEVSIKNGFFGRSKTTVKDRLGNKYETDKGLFGSKSTEVNVLGNSIKRKKGLFGGSDIQGSTMLGDKITTKKGWFGRRKTEVDISGVSSAVHDLWVRHNPTKKLAEQNQRTSPPTGFNADAGLGVQPQDYNNNGSDSSKF